MIPRSLSMFTLVTLIYIALAASFALAQNQASPPAAPAVVPSQIQALPAATAVPAEAAPAAAAPADPFGAPPAATAANAAAPAAANPFGQPANAAPAAPCCPNRACGRSPAPGIGSASHVAATPASSFGKAHCRRQRCWHERHGGHCRNHIAESAVTTATASTEVAVADAGNIRYGCRRTHFGHGECPA